MHKENLASARLLMIPGKWALFLWQAAGRFLPSLLLLWGFWAVLGSTSVGAWPYLVTLATISPCKLRSKVWKPSPNFPRHHSSWSNSGLLELARWEAYFLYFLILRKGNGLKIFPVLKTELYLQVVLYILPHDGCIMLYFVCSVNNCFQPADDQNVSAASSTLCFPPPK